MSYLDLFLSFFQIGLLSFGGGMAAVPLISQQVVNAHGWLTMTEFVDLVTIAEMTPGPIAVNASTFVGLRVGGVLGALAATAGCVAPACVLVTVLAKLYFKYRDMTYIHGTLSGLRPAIVALVAVAGVAIFKMAVIPAGLAQFNWMGLALFLAAFVVLRKWKTGPIYVMLGCGALGGVLYTALGMPV